MREIPRTCSFSYFYYMMPGSKGLSPHELAHRWVKDLRTSPDMSIKVGAFDPDIIIYGYVERKRIWESIY